VHDREFFLCFLIDEKVVTELMILKRATRVPYMPYLSFAFARTHEWKVAYIARMLGTDATPPMFRWSYASG
jgi:hypothetical protein